MRRLPHPPAQAFRYRRPMRLSFANVLTALASPAVAALGGAAVVFSEFDDAPGGILVGLLLVAGAGALNLWAMYRGT